MSRDLFTDPFFAELPGPVSFRETSAPRHRDAVESAGASVAHGSAADTDRHEPDQDWQPL